MGTTIPILYPNHSTPFPSGLRLVRRGWGWRDREGEEKRKTKKRGRDEAETRRKKKILDSNYYPPEPMYVPSHEEQAPTVVNNLSPAQKISRDMMQNEGKCKTKDRRIV